MALDSVPSYTSDLGSNRATSARKEERTWTMDTYAPYDDGHQWRKYGEKKLSSSNFPRFYYRCTYKNDMKCPATKQIQQKGASDPPLFSVTYFNHHTCNGSSETVGRSTRDSDAAAQPSPTKAGVSICFSSQGATGEQPAFLSSSASPSIRSCSYKNQQPDRSSSYTRQFQWAHSSSSSTGNAQYSEASALSRTLLPIGRSGCIEFFHFL
ncbi:hypothetical protein ABZP36_008761 [Zizania latifolia]